MEPNGEAAMMTELYVGLVEVGQSWWESVPQC